MRRAALVLAWLLHAAAASAQGAGGDLSTVRRALQIDPFAVAPYRLLSTGLPPAARRKLFDELSHGTRFSDKVLLARLSLDGGQVAQARAAVHDASLVLPADARTLDAFCQLALASGAYAEAALGTQRALDRGRTPPRLVTAAIAQLRQGKHKEGLALLAEARQKDPSGGATEAALDTLLGQRMAAEAAELLHAQLEAAGAAVGSAAQWRRLADLERQLGHASASSAALLRALDAETSPTGRRATSQQLLRSYKDKHALAELSKQLKGSKTPARLVLRGDVEAALGHGKEAAQSWEAAAALDPNDPDPSLRLATAAKTPAERIARYESLAKAHPNELRYTVELADMYFDAKDTAGGKRTLREAASRFASSPTAQDQLARRLTERGDAEGALQCRKRAAELDPRSSEAAFVLGDAYRAAGKRAEAVAAYDDSIERAGGGKAAYERVIDALDRAKYDAEADAKIVQARTKWPGDLALIRRHAETLERRHDLKRALDAWRELDKKAARGFEQDQAQYNVKRLEMAVAMGAK